MRGLGACPAGAARYRCGALHSQRPIPMIDLYALTSPNVQKIYIMLEECGLPYKEHFVDVWKGDQYKPEFSQGQSQQQDPGDRRSRRARRQAVQGDRIRRHPALPRREDRQIPAQGHGQEIRGDPVADDPAHRRRADVRAMDPFQAVRAQDRQRLFDGALYLGIEAALRGAGEAARRGALSRRRRTIPSPTSRPSRGPATTTPRA